MGLPQIGVEAVVNNLSGYQAGLKAVENATAQAGNQIASTGRNMDDMGEKSNRLGKIMDVAFGNIIAGAVFKATEAFSGFVGGIFEAGQQGILVEKQLNAVLASTKGVAGVTAENVNQLADALSNSTKFSDDQIVSAQNLLLTFTAIHKDTFPRTTAAVLDMATAMHMDLQSASIAVGKALQFPVEGVTALQRQGVRLTEEQKQMVKQFVATGQTAKAQALILKELETEFGGSAEAVATPWDILNNKMQKFQETIGRAIIPAINGVLEALTPFIDQGLKGMSDFLNNEVAPAFAKTKAVIDDFFVFLNNGKEGPLQAFGDALKTQFQSGALHDIGQAFVDAGNLIDQAGPVIRKALEGIPEILGSLGSTGGLAAGALLLLSFSIGKIAITGLAEGLGAMVGPLFGIAGGAGAAVLPIGALALGIGAIVLAVTNFSKLQDAFASGGAFGDIGDKVRKATQDILTPFVKLGADIATALVVPLANIVSGVNNLPAAFSDAAGKVLAALGPIIGVLDRIQAFLKNPTGAGGTGDTHQAGQTGMAGQGTTNSVANQREHAAFLQQSMAQKGPLPADVMRQFGLVGQGPEGAVQIPTELAPPKTEGFLTGITDVVTKATADAQLGGAAISAGVATGITAGGPQVNASAGKVVTGAIAPTQAAAGGFSSVGVNIIAGIVAGIQGNAGGVEAALSGIIAAAIARIKSQLGIASPSKVFAGIGGQMMTGWQEGIMAGAGKPQMAAAMVSNTVIARASGGNYNDSSSRTNVYNLGLQPYQPGGAGNDNAMQTWRG